MVAASFMISLENVGMSYDGGVSWVVRELSLEIQSGELLVLLGESGCGKTTTLKTINRLAEATAGDIVIDGENVQKIDPVELRRRIGYVFQGIGLFPHMTIAQNIGIVPKLLGWDAAAIRERTEELLALVSLRPEDFRDRLPRELSGGQRQRVGVARALAARPNIVLMDEPFGALDPLTRTDLQREYKAIHDDLGLTTVIVTHDMTEAILMADRIAVMSGGAILQLGTPKTLLTEPADDYVRALMQMPRSQVEGIERLLDGAS